MSPTHDKERKGKRREGAVGLGNRAMKKEGKSLVSGFILLFLFPTLSNIKQIEHLIQFFQLYIPYS